MEHSSNHFSSRHIFINIISPLTRLSNFLPACACIGLVFGRILGILLFSTSANAFGDCREETVLGHELLVRVKAGHTTAVERHNGLNWPASITRSGYRSVAQQLKE